MPLWERVGDRAWVAEALRLLGVERLVLGIHDSSFPSTPEEDTGRGTPYGDGGRQFLRFVSELGFTGVQLGPQGQTSRDNPSPYDGTLFSRNKLSIAHLAQGGTPLSYRESFESTDRALRAAATRFRSQSDETTAFEAFCFAQAHWLDPDALFHALEVEHGHDDWGRWPQLDRELLHPQPAEALAAAGRIEQLRAKRAEEIFLYRYAQFLAHEQHRALQEECKGLGLKLYADLQAGCSHRDRWRLEPLFLQTYRMGAPPSRTTPEGQPWGFPVLDPGQYGANGEGAAAQLVLMRMRKALAEYDGVRIDHPHGLVCPWVYDAHRSDPLAAVQSGARLFDSPDLPDHAALASYAIARPEQLNRSKTRWDDRWVSDLDDAQVHRYGLLFDVMMGCVAEAGRSIDDVHCEVLSTWPFPLWKVMRKYRLGRMRVTQKANLDDPGDVYRSENAEPNDWMMVGNHDTPPLWQLLDRWQESAAIDMRAAYLSERLVPDPRLRADFAAKLKTSPTALAEAMFADLFCSRAKNFSIFFADLFGMTERYNLAGQVDARNWTLRVPNDYRARYEHDARSGDALCLPRVLAIALRARGLSHAGASTE